MKTVSVIALYLNSGLQGSAGLNLASPESSSEVHPHARSEIEPFRTTNAHVTADLGLKVVPA